MAASDNPWRGGSAPPHLRQCPPLRYLWRRMHVNNKNVMLAIVGDPGEGKSWAALRLAELLDPEFHAEKVAFRPEYLLRRINEDHPMGDVTIADEAGVSMNAKTWWESDQIQIGNILETWRHQNRMMIFTLPVFKKLQKDARGLMNVLLTAYGIDRQESMSRWRFRLVETNNETGEIYKPYPRLPHPVTGQEVMYRTIDLGLPTEAIRSSYQERKEAYTDELNQQALESAEAAAEEEGAPVDPRQVATDIAKNGVEDYISTHGTTGEPYINKELIRVNHNLSHSDANAVKSLLEQQIDVQELA